MTSENEIAVRISQVTKLFGTQKAVDDLSLAVPRGSIYGFIGPNGSGKTTTIRMILHIFHPDSGTIEVLGETGKRAANDRIGYLPEERGLYKKMKVREVLQYYGTLKGMTVADARASAERWVEKMGLTEWMNRKVEALSKGMAQKIQFITSIISKPDLIILDEPFSGLDPVNMEVIREAILELKKEGATILFSTHDMSVAELMCDFIFMIYQGRKVLDGTMNAIQSQYGNDTLRVRADRAIEILPGLPGVESVRDHGQYQEVRFMGDPQEILSQLANQTRVSLFEITQPSLHDIFVRIARPQEVEVVE